MRVVGRYGWVCVSTILALVAVACGGQTSFSPTSPTGISGRGPAGAAITGTVTGGASQATFSTTEFSTMATTRPVTVSVVGTSISSVIDGSGRFHLTGVPAGDVQLRFTATGLDATLTLRGVQTGDRIDIKVRLTDTSVRIEAERRERDDDDDDEAEDDDSRDGDELKGAVSALAGTCPDITFTLNGVTVKASSATRYEGVTCTQVRNMTPLEVHGRRQGDGSIQAAEIELED